MASVRGILNIQSLNELTYESPCLYDKGPTHTPVWELNG